MSEDKAVPTGGAFDSQGVDSEGVAEGAAGAAAKSTGTSTTSRTATARRTATTSETQAKTAAAKAVSSKKTPVSRARATAPAKGRKAIVKATDASPQALAPKRSDAFQGVPRVWPD